MSANLFIPKLKHIEEESSQPVEVSGTFNCMIIKIVQYSAVVLTGLIPIFFIPKVWATLGFDKTLFAIVFIIFSAVLLSFLALRQSHMRTVLPTSLGFFVLFVMSAAISGFLSGDTQDTFRGSFIEITTVLFLAVMALVMMLPLILQGSKQMTIKAITFFGCMASVLVIYNFLRLLFGPEFLSFGTFTAITDSPIGGFNDLAIFSALVIILSVISLVQLPLNRIIQGILSSLVVLSIIILAVINFFNIWIIVGLFSLLVFVYLLSRDKVFTSENQVLIPPRRSLLAIILTAVICIVSAAFVIAGDVLGDKLSNAINVSYVEVRPSLTATIGIAKSVYEQDLLFGVGPNRFTDAWHLYKDKRINDTIFWEREFSAGSSFVSTVFVTTGIVGGVLLVLFHIWFLYLGYRTLLKTTQVDLYWRYFGSFSFAAAGFLWLMSYIYVPGAAVLLLTALFTGFAYVASGALFPVMVRRITLATNQRRGFLLMSGVIMVVVASVTTLYTIGAQYIAQAKFAQAQTILNDSEEIDVRTAAAYELYKDDRFLNTRVQIKLLTLQTLLSTQNPTEEEQQTFLRAAEQALILSEQAITKDVTNPSHHAVLAAVYANLSLAGVTGARERVDLSLAEAKKYDPHNPVYYLIAAQVAARSGDLERARQELTTALALKRNYTEALYLLAQLDIAEGKTEAAIETTRAIIVLEPRNSTRYFQLGMLLAAVSKTEEAALAFQFAIQLEPQHVNARYLLALAYLDLGQVDAALEQLRVVQTTNQDNIELASLIEQVESGEYQAIESNSFETPVREGLSTLNQSEQGLGLQDVESDLLSPVNMVRNPSESALVPEVNSLPEVETINNSSVIE
jgi:tetratricopeptide (TPR) repeat protein